MFLIVISIFLLFTLYPKETFLYSDTILGKMMALFIIIYSTYENVIYGLFACIFIIWFYQSDMLDRYRIIVTETFSPQAVYSPSSSSEKNIQSTPTLDPLPLDKVYPTELSLLKTESETVFRNQNCSEDLELMYKNTKILRKENIQSLFPELSFSNDNTCNPCDSSCRFRKIENEKELMAKSARGNEDNIWEWATSWFIEKAEPYQGIGYVASYFS